jgi:hypothetical protein
MIQNIQPGSRIRILIFLPIPDPVVKKTPDPKSGSTTLLSVLWILNDLVQIRILKSIPQIFYGNIYVIKDELDHLEEIIPKLYRFSCPKRSDLDPVKLFRF